VTKIEGENLKTVGEVDQACEESSMTDTDPGPALQRLEDSELTELVVTNSSPQEENMRQCDKIKVIDIAPMMAEAIRRTHNGESISVLFPM
jgi:phosphoribosylpyrophosphate synthetase